MSDLYVSPSGDLVLDNDGQPKLDGTFETAAYLSLFAPPSWWGNAYLSDEGKLESRFSSLFRASLNNQTRLNAEVYAREALAWLSDVGAQSVTVSAAIADAVTLQVLVDIVGPAGDLTKLRYGVNWTNQKIEVNP